MSECHNSITVCAGTRPQFPSEEGAPPKPVILPSGHQTQLCPGHLHHVGVSCACGCWLKTEGQSWQPQGEAPSLASSSHSPACLSSPGGLVCCDSNLPTVYLMHSSCRPRVGPGAQACQRPSCAMRSSTLAKGTLTAVTMSRAIARPPEAHSTEFRRRRLVSRAHEGGLGARLPAAAACRAPADSGGLRSSFWRRPTTACSSAWKGKCRVSDTDALRCLQQGEAGQAQPRFSSQHPAHRAPHRWCPVLSQRPGSIPHTLGSQPVESTSWW